MKKKAFLSVLLSLIMVMMLAVSCTGEVDVPDDPAVPDTPAVPVEQGKVNMSFESVAGAARYKVTVVETGEVVEVTSPSAALDLKNGSYTFRIEAYDRNGKLIADGMQSTAIQNGKSEDVKVDMFDSTGDHVYFAVGAGESTNAIADAGLSTIVLKSDDTLTISALGYSGFDLQPNPDYGSSNPNAFIVSGNPVFGNETARITRNGNAFKVTVNGVEKSGEFTSSGIKLDGVEYRELRGNKGSGFYGVWKLPAITLKSDVLSGILDKVVASTGAVEFISQNTGVAINRLASISEDIRVNVAAELTRNGKVNVSIDGELNAKLVDDKFSLADPFAFHIDMQISVTGLEGLVGLKLLAADSILLVEVPVSETVTIGIPLTRVDKLPTKQFTTAPFAGDRTFNPCSNADMQVAVIRDAGFLPFFEQISATRTDVNGKLYVVDGLWKATDPGVGNKYDMLITIMGEKYRVAAADSRFLGYSGSSSYEESYEKLLFDDDINLAYKNVEFKIEGDEIVGADADVALTRGRNHDDPSYTAPTFEHVSFERTGRNKTIEQKFREAMREADFDVLTFDTKGNLQLNVPGMPSVNIGNYAVGARNITVTVDVMQIVDLINSMGPQGAAEPGAPQVGSIQVAKMDVYLTLPYAYDTIVLLTGPSGNYGARLK